MDHQRIHSSYDNTRIAKNIALRSESLAERLLHPYDFKNISDGCEIAILRANKLQRLLGSESDILRKYLLWSRFQCLEKLPIGEPKSTALFIGSEEWVKTLSTLFDYLDNAKSEYLPNISGDFGLNDFSCTILASIYNKIYPEDLRDGVGVHIYACSIAIEKLKNVCTPEELELLSDDALKDMLKHLWAMQHQACISIFDRSRSLHERLFSGREEERLRFHNWLINNAGYKDLLKEHSALARIIANGVDLWVNDTSQLLKRLKKDQHEIVETIDIGVKPFIIKVDDGLSDPHDGKQFVKRLWFKNGSGLIYKPRDISLLKSLGNAIQIIKENAGNIDLRVPRCISKDNYGWAELINQEECLSEKEVETYFNRCGQLVALLYLTRTNDIHHENLIASGDQPVLIDTDTLFYPGFFDLSEPHYPTDLSSNTELAVEESILSSGVLPFWDNINGELKDLSGISSSNEAGKNIARFQGKVQ